MIFFCEVLPADGSGSLLGSEVGSGALSADGSGSLFGSEVGSGSGSAAGVVVLVVVERSEKDKKWLLYKNRTFEVMYLLPNVKARFFLRPVLALT
jgi:hypothetical protein